LENLGATEEAGKVATGTVDALKSQPLALALVVVNVLFLAVGGYALHDVGGSMKARQIRQDELLASLMERCLYAMPPQHKQESNP
jgi:hypothetical protein